MGTVFRYEVSMFVMEILRMLRKLSELSEPNETLAMEVDSDFGSTSDSKSESTSLEGLNKL